MILWFTLRKLRSHNINARIAAIRKLSQSKDKRALEPLLALLIEDYDSRSKNIRSEAVSALDAIDPNWRTLKIAQDVIDQSVTRRMNRLVSISDWSACQAIVQAITDDGAPAEPVLLRFLSDSDLLHRARAAWVLLEMKPGDERASATLLETLRDPHTSDEVRRDALFPLQRITLAPRFAEELFDLLEDRDEEVRKYASRALNNSLYAFGINSIPLLKRALKGPKEVQRGVLLVVERDGSSAKSLEFDLAEMLPSQDEYLGYCIICALAAIGPSSTETVTACLSQLKQTDEWKASILLKIAGFGQIAVNAIVQELTRTYTSSCTIDLFSILGKLGSSAKDATPALVELLSHYDPMVQGHAARALGQIGCPEAIPGLALLIAKETTVYFPRAEALSALRGMGSKGQAAAATANKPYELVCECLLSVVKGSEQDRIRAKENLKRMGPDVIPLLRRVTETGRPEEVFGLARVIDLAPELTNQVVMNLSRYLKMPTLDAEAAEALGEIGPAAAVAKKDIRDWLGYVVSAQRTRTEAIKIGQDALWAIEHQQN
jgi:HEAT repeat protein